MHKQWDYTTKDGAYELARKIEAFWEERGERVICVPQFSAGERGGLTGGMFVVRSDMLNGRPKRKKE